MKLFSRFLIPVYILTIVALFLYSYTQVDLSLTLSRVSLWQTVEKWFQYIGYFNRPLSTALFLGILTLLGFCYWGFAVGKMKRKTLWILIFFTAVVLVFSYNAFSYDLFNYIFDAKIVTHYMQNPYTHRALDFSGDPMLSFMHWVERTYPYGPVWLFVTVPVSFIGLQIFLPTFFLFKGIAALSYVGICWSVEKILQKTDKDNALLGLSLFAFSPLVIIEGLVSAHNDMLMIVFASFALLTFVSRKSVWSFLLLFLSIGVKFATAVLLPLWIIGFFFKKKGSVHQLSVISFIFLAVAAIAASLRTNFQPWYLLFLFPFAALIYKQKGILVGFSIFSTLSLLQYVPFLYTGNWDKPIPSILSVMLWSSLGLSIIAAGIISIAKRR